ncbi:hypothetical protein [Luteolibacter soli]|uniref:hypothetical protein n=1 Tax=Luteolibacter soli TaxID=3135280 RepID=UPI00311943B1
MKKMMKVKKKMMKGGGGTRGVSARVRVRYREEYAGWVEKLYKLGAGDEEVAGFFGVRVEVLERWMRRHGEFAEGVRRGRMWADAEVAERLFQRAMGYSREVVKVMSRGGKEEPVRVPYEEHYPPDVRACIFWLRNRRPDLWRERVLLESGDGEGTMLLEVSEEVLEEMRGMVKVAEGVVGPGGEVPSDQ